MLEYSWCLAGEAGNPTLAQSGNQKPVHINSRPVCSLLRNPGPKHRNKWMTSSTQYLVWQGLYAFASYTKIKETKGT
jgi:hypothetical protein